MFGTLLIFGFIMFTVWMINNETGVVTKIWDKGIAIIRKYSK